MRRIPLLLAVCAVALGACGDSESPDDDGRFTILTSSYPVEYAVARVAGQHADVRSLVPAGVEPHDYELTPDDADAIEDAHVFFFSGEAFQSAIAKAARRRDGVTLDISSGGILQRGDPHFWLDPSRLTMTIDPIEQALAKADPGHGAAFATNADRFQADLAQLDADFAATLSSCKRKEIVTAHAAFDYLVRRYGLTQHAISGISPESEPDPRRIAELSQLIERGGVTTVFYEELIPMDFADTLAKETGAKTAVLHTIESLSEDQLDANEDYDALMRKNLAALSAALDCRLVERHVPKSEPSRD